MATSNDHAGISEHGGTTIQLEIRQMPSPTELAGHTHVIRWEGTAEEVRTVCEAWATVRGYDKLQAVLDRVFNEPAPQSGFQIVIHKPAALLLIFRWPWATALPSLDVWP